MVLHTFARDPASVLSCMRQVSSDNLYLDDTTRLQYRALVECSRKKVGALVRRQAGPGATREAVPITLFDCLHICKYASKPEHAKLQKTQQKFEKQCFLQEKGIGLSPTWMPTCIVTIAPRWEHYTPSSMRHRF